MTRLFLEIKNITLCAEPSFFILLYFLCKNLLFLCAEHHYPFLLLSFSEKTPSLMVADSLQLWSLVFEPGVPGLFDLVRVCWLSRSARSSSSRSTLSGVSCEYKIELEIKPHTFFGPSQLKLACGNKKHSFGPFCEN